MSSCSSLPQIETPRTLDELFAAVQSSSQRVLRVEFQGRSVWVKRYDLDRPSVGQRAHRLLTLVARNPFWRSSPALRPEEMVEREIRKYSAFDRSGIAVPTIIASRGAVLVVADVGPSLARLLKQLRTDGATAAHDRLLVRLAEALGEVHRAGLCHGRPHPRDMGLVGGRIAFFDFEEEPERVMPLADAQARDVWILFLHITSTALDAATPLRALSAYGRLAPAETRAQLASRVGTMRWIVPLGRALSRIHFDSDLRRLISATMFLAAATMAPGMHVGPGVSDDFSTMQSRGTSARSVEGEDDDDLV
jgi:tRNA A-37 threonylcarbamoyl transferase component Bud32